MDPVATREYGLQMQSALLRTITAVIRAGAEDPQQSGQAVRAELEGVERQIAQLPGAGRPMLSLALRFGWSAHEIDFVWATVALATDPRVLVHARALDTGAAQGMSTALYSRIANLDAAGSHLIGRALHPDRSLPRSGLLLAAPGCWLPTNTPWRPAPELLHHLLDERDGDRLPPGISEIQVPVGVVLDVDQRAALDLIRSALFTSDILMVLHGAAGTGRRSALAQVTDRPVLALDLSLVDSSAGALEHALVGWTREVSLRDAIAVIVDPEELERDGRDARLRMLAQYVDQIGGPTALVTQREGFELRSSRPMVRVAWPVPDVGARLALWRDLAGGDHPLLAQRYRIGAGAIERAVSSARAIARKRITEPLTTGELVAGVRHNIAERMAELAERVTVKQTWDDCVLSEDVETQVMALIGRAEQAHLVYEQWGYRAKVARGTGIVAMFSGPPGTGKTMVAGLIANRLGLELYQVDLSKVVSKWIGETEKQLSRLFDAAEDGHAVLLFDEADSLFGKRSSEMKGATDRYANLEINFLLQRVESFHGIVILTTNLDASIDKAFRRRLAAHVVFQPPEEHERAQLWKRMVASDGAPLGRDIDERLLARQFPKMTGANIRNAALAAAFLAAAQRRQTIDHATLVAAARSEYLSMGHVLTTSSL